MNPRRVRNSPDILPPTQDLSDKTLQAVQGHRVFPGESQRGFQYLLRSQQADVQKGRKQRMKQIGLAGKDGILIIPKIPQPISQKIFQPPLGRLMGHRIDKLGGFPGMVRKFSGYVIPGRSDMGLISQIGKEGGLIPRGSFLRFRGSYVQRPPRGLPFSSRISQRRL